LDSLGKICLDQDKDGLGVCWMWGFNLALFEKWY